MCGVGRGPLIFPCLSFPICKAGLAKTQVPGAGCSSPVYHRVPKCPAGWGAEGVAAPLGDILAQGPAFDAGGAASLARRHRQPVSPAPAARASLPQGARGSLEMACITVADTRPEGRAACLSRVAPIVQGTHSVLSGPQVRHVFSGALPDRSVRPSGGALCACGPSMPGRRGCRGAAATPHRGFPSRTAGPAQLL